MVSAVSSVVVPAMVSSGIFAARRFNKGFDNINEDPVYGIMNLGLAAGQGLKTFRNMEGVAKIHSISDKVNKLDKILPKDYVGTGDAVLSVFNKIKTSEAGRLAGSAVGTIADHINPFIIATGAVKVLTSDDKAETFARESLALGSMFGCEHLAKNILGMPKIKVNSSTGLKETKQRIPLHNKLPKQAKQYVENQINNFYKLCNNTTICGKTLSGLPLVLKGLAFVGASIAGYEIGEWLGNKLFGEKENTGSKKTK